LEQYLIRPHLEIIENNIASSLDYWYTIRLKSLALGEQSKVIFDIFFKKKYFADEEKANRHKFIEE
jgi:hypothetical protein